MSYKPINNEFYKKTRAFVILALDLLISFLHKGEQIPHMMVEKTYKEKDGSWRTTQVRQPLYSTFIDRHKKEVESLPEYINCITIMQSDSTISKHVDCLIGTQDIQIRRTKWEYLRYFLTEQLLKRPERFEFDIKIFDRTYYDLEQFFYSNKIKTLVFFPLQNFNSDVDEIDLGNDLRIRTIELNELEQLINLGKRLSLFRPLSYVYELKYAVEFSYTTKKVSGNLKRPIEKALSRDIVINEKLSKLITALRLFKSGIVSKSGIIKTQEVVPAIMGGIGISGFDNKPLWDTLTSRKSREPGCRGII